MAVMAIVTGCNCARDKKAMPYAGTAVVLLLFAANIAAIQGIALDQMEANRRDRAEEIVRCIQEYETVSGQSVKAIVFADSSAASKLLQ